MVRPRKIRQVGFEPDVTYFKPRAVPLKTLEEVELTIDELETLRLANIEKLSQEKAAEQMEIHQSTFQRTLARAQEKVTDALVHGKAIKIHGGDYRMQVQDSTGPDQNGGRGRGQRAQGRMQGRSASGPRGSCVCPECGYRQAHTRGMPCVESKCPKCGQRMTRG